MRGNLKKKKQWQEREEILKKGGHKYENRNMKFSSPNSVKFSEIMQLTPQKKNVFKRQRKI